MSVIIKKGENVNHENFDDVKNIKPWIMVSDIDDL